VLFDILRSDSRLVSIDAIISDSIHESIRTVVNETGVALPLPARSFSTKILAALAKLPFVITNITDTQIILNLTHRVIDKVRRNELSATALSKLLFAKSDAQMIALQEAIESTPSLATRELLDACRSLGWDGSKICEELLELHIEVGAPPVCSLDASAQSTMQWSKAYLEYALSMFSREKEPKEEISRSFQQWLITQPTRVASPNFNWRAVSSSVRKLLAENRRVLLIVVDAMGSLVAKELAETLRTNLRESNVNYRDLFGPLPTITENAKLAVATGIDKYKHPAGPTENKLFAAYGDILKSFDQVQVLKSWVSNELFILPNAKLILYLENQLDDKLHECIDFKSLQDQFRVVSEKVFNCINNALSLDGDLSVIITADHGLTSIQKTDTEHNYNSLGDVSDRLIKPVNSFVSAPEGFVEVRPEGAKDDRYFVVQARKRLTSSSFPFVHGGLTPEEVLIPLIIIEPVRKASISTRVQIHVGDSRVVMHGDSWQIPLRLVGGDDPANGLLIEAVSPFNGSYIQQHLNALAVANINLNVTSNVSQTGLVKLKLRLRYTDKSTHQVCLNDYCLTIEFPQPLLIRDQDVVDFNSMFE
jgi:hypothetical protein